MPIVLSVFVLCWLFLAQLGSDTSRGYILFFFVANNHCAVAIIFYMNDKIEHIQKMYT